MTTTPPESPGSPGDPPPDPETGAEAAAPAPDAQPEAPAAAGPAPDAPPADEPATTAPPPADEPSPAEVAPPPEEPATTAAPPPEEPATTSAPPPEEPATTAAPPADEPSPAAAPVAAAPVADVADAPPEEPSEPRHRARHRSVKVLAVLLLISGVILAAAGAVTWGIVRNQLVNEHITVSDDADQLAGDDVNGPFTAYAQANVINKHAMAESGGLTYAQLEQDDPVRQTVMTASFLRASLYTSVVAFGVAAFAFAMGILMILVAWALLRLNKAMATT